MKKYLSFGGGVNSVAMMLLLLDQKEDFEAIFVNHETDWPETYEYFNMFQKWLKKNGHKQITVLKPSNQSFASLYDYCRNYKMVPSIFRRWCTSVFKMKPIQEYVEIPCFMFIGIDYGEIKRAKISINKGIENRWPLIEQEITRNKCKKIIIDHGLKVPIKSGCYICPFQKGQQWRELKKKHPNLFCKAIKLEERNMQYRESIGKKPMSLLNTKYTLKQSFVVNQPDIFEPENTMPCQCGL